MSRLAQLLASGLAVLAVAAVAAETAFTDPALLAPPPGTAADRLETLIAEPRPRHDQWLSAPVADGRLIRADQRRVRAGVLDAALYELPRDTDEQALLSRWIGRLEALDLQLDWQCRGRACGASNDWANGVYEEKRLYGLDARQSFWTGSRPSDGVVASLYLVRRGNQRVYARIEVLHPEAGEADRQRRDAPSWRLKALPGVALDADDGVRLTDADAFRRYRLDNAARRLVVVVGAEGGANAVENLRRSAVRAARVRRWLGVQGLSEWEVMPIGPLLPEWSGETLGVLDLEGVDE